MKLWDKRFPSKWTDFIQFFDKNVYLKSHNFRSKISIVEKEPTSFKKRKIFITPGLEDTVLSELDVVNVWREYLAIKICQNFPKEKPISGQWHSYLSIGFLNLFHPVTSTVLTNYISYEANINYITISIT